MTTTRTQWKTRTHQLREQARRTRTPQHATCFIAGDRLYTAAYDRLTDGLTIRPSLISERSLTSRHAEEMHWAAYYRRRVTERRYLPHERQSHISAARACLADAWRLRTAEPDIEEAYP